LLNVGEVGDDIVDVCSSGITVVRHDEVKLVSPSTTVEIIARRERCPQRRVGVVCGAAGERLTGVRVCCERTDSELR
jgi:vancomycin permeability regulator SanA